jgi:hypothetical protein
LNVLLEKIAPVFTAATPAVAVGTEHVESSLKSHSANQGVSHASAGLDPHEGGPGAAAGPMGVALAGCAARPSTQETPGDAGLAGLGVVTPVDVVMLLDGTQPALPTVPTVPTDAPGEPPPFVSGTTRFASVPTFLPSETERPTVVALSGPAGVGKSALAREVCTTCLLLEWFGIGTVSTQACPHADYHTFHSLVCFRSSAPAYSRPTPCFSIALCS